MSPRRRLRRGAVALALLCGAPVCAQAQAQAQAQTPAHGHERALLLGVSINGLDTNKVADFKEVDGSFFTTARELRELGIVTPRLLKGDEQVAITSIKGLSYTFDERSQTISLKLPLNALLTQKLDVATTTEVVETSPRSSGVVLNYDVTATGGAGSAAVYGLGSLRYFGPAGVFSSNVAASDLAGSSPLVRLDTTYTYADPRSLRSFQAGDVISAALPYTRSVRLGGLQLSSNFALRPDLITYPLPVVSGSTALPSTVDVLVNGVQQLSRAVVPGPFYVPELPVVGGAGQVSVIVRDATGQQTTRSSQFYATSALLNPGLSSFSFEAGAVRRRFGEVSNDYGAVAASATERFGLTRAFTLEGHAEADGRFGLVTGGGVLALGTLGVASFAAGASTSAAGTGMLGYAAVERTTLRYHLGASAQLTNDAYRDIAALNADPVPRRLFQVSAGVFLGRQGSLGLAYTQVDRRYSPFTLNVTDAAAAQSMADANSAVEEAHAALISVTYSREVFGRAYAYATAYQDLHGGSGAITAGLSIRFGRSGSINASLNAGAQLRQGSIEAASPEINPGDVGWRLYGAGGDDTRGIGEVRYRGQWGDVGLGVDHSGAQTFVRGEAQGALVLMDRRLYASNTISDGFALVEDGGYPGVRVLLDNRVIGRTDGSGHLLLPGLVAYQGNKVSLDPTDLPLDAEWDALDLHVKPQDRSGVMARFKVKTLRAALVTVKLASGEAAPLGARVRVDGAPAVQAQVGYDGQVYLKDLSGRRKLIIELPDGGFCTAAISIAPGAKGVVNLPDVLCKVEAAAKPSDSRAPAPPSHTKVSGRPS